MFRAMLVLGRVPIAPHCGGGGHPPLFTLRVLPYIYFFTWISPSIHVICIYIYIYEGK